MLLQKGPGSLFNFFRPYPPIILACLIPAALSTLIFILRFTFEFIPFPSCCVADITVLKMCLINVQERKDFACKRELSKHKILPRCSLHTSVDPPVPLFSISSFSKFHIDIHCIWSSPFRSFLGLFANSETHLFSWHRTFSPWIWTQIPFFFSQSDSLISWTSSLFMFSLSV